MSGQYKGVQVIMKKKYPKTLKRLLCATPWMQRYDANN